MIQTTAMARLGRSLSTRTQQGVSEPGIRENDLVDVWRRPTTKDVSGWKGPYKVVRLEPDRGQIIVSMNGQDRPSRAGDVRLPLIPLEPPLAAKLRQVITAYGLVPQPV